MTPPPSSANPLGWLFGAAALGFTVPALFSGWLGLPRDLYLLPYLAAVSVFMVFYARAARLDLRSEWRARPVAGLAGAAVAGAIVLRHVYAQPASTPPEGLALAAALVWLGLAYGAADALFLSVLPVVAARRATARPGRPRPLAAAALGLAASALLAAAYHLGYPEFRGPAVAGPVAGNLILTASYLVTGSPIAPVGAHVLMHLGAVLHGIDTTVQLPPHG